MTLLLLMPAFSLPCAPHALPVVLHRTGNAPLPCVRRHIRSFGAEFKPRWIIRARTLDQ
jgi:hypothetical protein